jgi:hypothetical protein
VLAQRTMQSDAVLVTEHAEVELLVDSVEECVVVCWLFVGLLFEGSLCDGWLSVGVLSGGWLLGGLPPPPPLSEGPSDESGSEQSPDIWMPKTLMHGR